MREIKVFISYSHDDKDFVTKLVSDLREKGINVWFDENIQPGDRFPIKIHSNLSTSTHFIAILSKSSVKSRQWIEIEASKALAKEGKDAQYQIIPLCHNIDCNDIPDLWMDRTIIDFYKQEYEVALKKLIEKILGNESASSNDKSSSGLHIYNYKWSTNSRRKSAPYYLETFRPDDEELFNTREIFIDEVDRVLLKIKKHESNFITIEGESGSGKSSLVLAGLVPRLAKESSWKFVYVEFNEDPYQDLAAGLVSIINDIKDPIKTDPDQVNQLSIKIKESKDELKKQLQAIKDKNPGTRILMIADQLDSLYTKCTQEVRTNFLTLLKSSLQKENFDSIVLIATFDSSNFQKDGSDVQDYKNILGEDVEKIPSLTEENLIDLITKPAGKKGIEFESKLPEKIIKDLGDKKHDLMLLGAILVRIWEIKEKHKLKIVTEREYIESGGVDSALNDLASENYDSLKDKDKKEKARKLFLCMIHYYDKASGKIIPRRITVRSGEYADLIKRLSRIIKTTSNAKPDEVIEIEFFHAKLAENWKDLLDWIDHEENLNSARALEYDVSKWKEVSKGRWGFAKDWHSLHSGNQLKKDSELFQNHGYLFSDLASIETFLEKSRRISKIKFLLSPSLALVILLPVFIWWVFLDNGNVDKLRSMGENQLISSFNSNKNDGIENFKTKKYGTAWKNFEKAINSNKNDPESLIYKNNAKINEWKVVDPRIEPILIAASIPRGGNQEVALEMLRGVAHAQNDIMEDFESKCIIKDKNNGKETYKYKAECKDGIKGRPLQIMIVDDSNDKDIAIEIAKYLVNNPDVLAVIGHNSSEVSSKAAIEYQKGKLVMVTPTSFALKFEPLKYASPASTDKNFIYAAAYSHELLADKIVEEMKLQLNPDKPKILLCYDGSAFDQNAFAESFRIIADNKKEIELLGINAEGRDSFLESPFSKIPELFGSKKMSDDSCDFSERNLDLVNILTKAVDNGVNAIFVASHVNKIGDSITVLKKIRKDYADKQIKFFASPTLYTNQTLELGRKNVAGLTMAVSWFPQESPKEKESLFVKKAIEHWADIKKICDEGDKKSLQESQIANKENCRNPLEVINEIGITWRTALAYDVTHILKEAFNQSESISREELQESLSSEKFSFDGITGSVKFFSKCPENNINGVDCFPGKRMVVSDYNPLTIIKIQDFSPPKDFKLYRFKK